MNGSTLKPNCLLDQQIYLITLVPALSFDMAVTRSAIKRRQHADGHIAPTATQQPAHWRELHDPASGRLKSSRPAGSPAGSWCHTPWWHCVFHDPYERINFWTHFVPGALLLLLSALSAGGLVPGHTALCLWGICSGATHIFSALGHVYPDSHVLEKLDHVGIVASIVGTPMTALMAQEHDHLPTPMLYITGLLLVAAFLRPLPRVLGFVAGGGIAVVLYGRQLACPSIAAELLLYLTGAFCFLRNGGHSRWPGCTDHHLLHYFVTAASALHVWYIVTTL